MFCTPFTLWPSPVLALCATVLLILRNPALCVTGLGCGGIVVVSIPALERIPDRLLLRRTPPPSRMLGGCSV